MRSLGMLLIAACLSTAALSVPCGAGDFDDKFTDQSSMRCNGNLVTIGETKYGTREKCGPPSSRDERADTWVYDFGAGLPVYYLTFLEGQIVQIQTTRGQ